MGALWGAEVTPRPPHSLTFHRLYLLPCGRRRAQDAPPEWETEVRVPQSRTARPRGPAVTMSRRLSNGRQSCSCPNCCSLRM